MSESKHNLEIQNKALRVRVERYEATLREIGIALTKNTLDRDQAIKAIRAVMHSPRRPAKPVQGSGSDQS